MEIFNEMFSVWEKWRKNDISTTFNVSNWINPYGRDSRLSLQEELKQLNAHRNVRLLDLSRLSELIEECELELQNNCSHEWKHECERNGKSFRQCLKCNKYN